MKHLSLLYIFLIGILMLKQVYGQNTGIDFDYDILRHFGSRNGKLDSVSNNPAVGILNSKPLSIKYERDQYTRYDNIKIYPEKKLVDISAYACYEGNAPKITMKLFSTAPLGTLVEIQLGNKKTDNYPQGIHSQYQARTTKVNEWEELSFNFAQIPQGSEVKPTDIDKIIIVFSPNSKNADTYYFDELKGPPMLNNQ
jgi:hypothetical protein